MGIQIRNIVEVLISGDGWHKIKPGSFSLPYYEFSMGDAVVSDIGRALGGVPVAFMFTDHKTSEQVSGPITSVAAVKTVVPES